MHKNESGMSSNIQKGQYQLLSKVTVIGITGHAGNAFDKARNPIVEAAYKIRDIVQLSDDSVGTSVIIPSANAGRQFSTIPGECVFSVAIKCSSEKEILRVQDGLKDIVNKSYTPDTRSICEMYEVHTGKMS